MASEAAKAVAREVLETIGKGKRPNLSKIGVKHGYSAKSAAHGQIVQTKSYKNEIQPLILKLEAEREAIIERLKKTRNKAKYRDLIDGMDKVTKNIQLLNGGRTSNESIQISWE